MEFAWHVHHNVLLESLTEPTENRRQYITKNKSSDEIQTRLRLLQIVRGPLPKPFGEARKACDEAWEAYGEAWKAHGEAWKACDEAREAYDEARKAYDEARKACDEAWEAYDEARKACDEARKACGTEIEALHKKECPDCPWNGKTIFP